MKNKFLISFILLLAVVAAVFDYPKYFNSGADYINIKFQSLKVSKFKLISKIKIPHFKENSFRFGLDLLGGTHLTYQADMSSILENSRSEAISGIKDVIERRVNLFGVAEPVVQTTRTSGEYRLIVELAGIKDINQAIKLIGETPYLDFRELKGEYNEKTTFGDFSVTPLNGKFLQKSNLAFDQTTGKPIIELNFNDEGAKIFEELTGNNIGKPLGIFLDGEPLSTPIVQNKISGGKAVINGNFTVQGAKELVQRLNAGALPVPIKLISQKTVEASLGQESFKLSLISGLYAFLFVGLFMIIWYRLPGLIAVLALLVYTAFVLALFKLIPVTLTLSGIAGFILSVGMAVDANILIFARMREEFRSGKSFNSAVKEGPLRAWPSIRDSNVSTLLTCLVLYLFTTSVVKGFALTLAVGVVVSMFTAIYVSRLLLGLFMSTKIERWGWLWYK